MLAKVWKFIEHCGVTIAALAFVALVGIVVLITIAGNYIFSGEKTTEIT